MNNIDEKDKIVIIEPPKEASKEIIVENKGALSIDTYDADVVSKRIQAINSVAEIIASQLKDGIDYGKIPGTKNPTLLKAGAQKICLMYGLRARYEYKETIDRENGYVEYDFKCELIDKDDQVIFEGFGVCSSQEKKYSVQNPWDIRNTILKMAEKRSHVDATLKIGNLSAIYTQDLEDGNTTNVLSTTNVYLSKDDKLALYGLAYEHYDNLEEAQNAKNKTEKKEIIKKHLKNVFKEIGIEKTSFMSFEAADRDKFLDHINK